MNPLELKVEHYKQRVAELSVNYEEQVANLRVQLTLIDQELQELKAKNESEEAEDTSSE
jgi:small-conductance mechanosensitive channel